MSPTQSEQMMDLLKELALIKELDKQHDAGSRTELEVTEFEARQLRRQAIATEIKTLALPSP
jgi:hypothetical protein